MKRGRLGVAVLVYDVDVVGGMERQALEVAERLARRGARVRVFTTSFEDGFGPLPRARPIIERRGRLAIVRIPCFRAWDYEPSLRFFEAIAALFLIADARIDVIYAVQWTAGQHGARLARLLDRPLVVKLAGGGKNGDLAQIDRSARPRDALALLARADKIVCVSPEIEAEALARGIERERLLRIPNGIALERFACAAPAELGLARDAEPILFLGALRREKLLPWLVRAFAKLAARRPRAVLVLAGDGPEAATVRELARELAIESRVHLLGVRTDAPALLAAARAFVLPSESEGLSNALLEALASGVPVVASDVSGNRAVVTHERDALLVALSNEDALAAALERVLDDRALAARLAEAGRARARDFAIESVVASYERVFAELARAKRSSLELALRYGAWRENPGVLRIALGVLGRVARGAAKRIVRDAGGERRATEHTERRRSVPSVCSVAHLNSSHGSAGVAILVYNIDAAGGMERQAARLAERIAALGRRVVIVSTFFPKTLGIVSAWREPKLFERRRGVTIYRVPSFSSHWWGYPTSQEIYETLAAWILERHAGEIDTIYAVQGNSAGLHAEKIARVVERPVVLKLACSGEAGDFHAVSLSRDPERARARLRRLERIVYLNDDSRREALDAGIAAERLVHIPNGIDLDRFPLDLAPAALPEIAAPRELVVFVGRLSQQKRVSVLIEAFAKVAARRPRAQLAIVGDGPDRDELERAARERSDRIRFLGVRQDVPAILAAASAFVLPSAQEGISNALLEALALSVPSIATDIPGNRDMITHEENGLLVPVDDAIALERAIERLLEDRALAERLAAAGRARVERDYAIGRVAERYLALFDALPPRARPSLARFLARYVRSELTPLTWLVVRGALRSIPGVLGPLRAALTVLVVRTKKKLGIERDIIPRRKLARKA